MTRHARGLFHSSQTWEDGDGMSERSEDDLHDVIFSSNATHRESDKADESLSPSPSSILLRVDSPYSEKGGTWTPSSFPEAPILESPMEKFTTPPKTAISSPQVGHLAVTPKSHIGLEMNPMSQVRDSKSTRRSGSKAVKTRKVANRSSPMKSASTSPSETRTHLESASRSLAASATKTQLASAKAKVHHLTQGHDKLRERLAKVFAEEERSSLKVAVMEEQLRELKQQKAQEIEVMVENAKRADEDCQESLQEREEELKRLDKRVEETSRSMDSMTFLRTQVAMQTEQMRKGTEAVQKELHHVKLADRQLQREIDSLRRQLVERQEQHEARLVQAQQESDRHRQAMSALEAKHKEREDSLYSQVEHLRARQMGAKQEEKLLLMEQRILLLESESEHLKKTLDDGKVSAERATERKNESDVEVKSLRNDIDRLLRDGKVHLAERESEVELAMKQLVDVMSAKEKRLVSMRIV